LTINQISFQISIPFPPHYNIHCRLRSSPGFLASAPVWTSWLQQPRNGCHCPNPSNRYATNIFCDPSRSLQNIGSPSRRLKLIWISMLLLQQWCFCPSHSARSKLLFCTRACSEEAAPVQGVNYFCALLSVVWKLISIEFDFFVGADYK
jgi:hypothetical protein